MQVLRSTVEYKGRKAIVTYYSLEDSSGNNKYYYFFDELGEKKLSNGNRIATTLMTEVLDQDQNIEFSHVGVVDESGNEVIPFIYSGIRNINDETLLVISANPESQNVLDCIEMRKNLDSTNNELISRANTIKDKVLSKMGPDGRFVFNTLYSEAFVFDINGKLLVGPYSFIGYNPNTNMLTMSDNTIESPVVEYSLINKEATDENNNIDVSNVDLEPGLVDGAMEAMVSENLSNEILDGNKPPVVGEEALTPEVSEDVLQTLPEVAPDAIQEVSSDTEKISENELSFADVPPGDNPDLIFGENSVSDSVVENTEDTSLKMPDVSLDLGGEEISSNQEQQTNEADVPMELKIDESSLNDNNNEEFEIEEPPVNDNELEFNSDASQVNNNEEVPLDLSSFDVPNEQTQTNNQPWSNYERLPIDNNNSSSARRKFSDDSGALYEINLNRHSNSDIDRVSRNPFGTEEFRDSRSDGSFSTSTYSSPVGNVFDSVKEIINENGLLKSNLKKLNDEFSEWMKKHNDLENGYTKLARDYDSSIAAYDKLNGQYNNSIAAYDELSSKYNRSLDEIGKLNGIIDEYKKALKEYDAIKNYINASNASNSSPYSDSGFGRARY